MRGVTADVSPRVAKKTVLTAIAALALVLAPASPAGAHAELVSATPAPGTGLPQAPGAVVLRFNEPLNMRLSEIRVLDSDGQDVAEGPSVAVVGDPQAMRRKLGLLATDRYTVEWTTTSTVDGHTLHGSYSFGIGTAAAGNESVSAGPVDSEGWLGLVGRFVALTGLVLWAGSAFLVRVAGRAKVPELRLRRVTRTAPLFALLGTALSLTSTAIVATGSPAAVGDLVFGGRSGVWRLALMVAAALGAILGPRRIVAQRALVLLALVAEAASGHAASSSAPFAATLSFAVHLGAVGVWVFAIVASVLSPERLRTALRMFTPYAVGAAVVVALTGLVNATIELGHFGDLFSTAYGRVVVLKVAAFILMAALGLAHYLLRLAPKIEAGKLTVAVRSEAVAAALALALATTLVSFPNPPGEGEAAEDAGGSMSLARVASGDALSIADASGPFIVGLTLLPPAPGDVFIRVDVVGVEPGDGLRDARIAARGGKESTLEIPLRPCGFGCFEGNGVIDTEGRWRFEVSMNSSRGPVEMEATVLLPAADGGDELEAVIAEMERLNSARMREDLSGRVGGPMLVSRYLFEAPDKMSITTRGSRQLIIDQRRFRKPEPNAKWEEGTWPGSGFTWPEDYYRSFWHGPVAVRALGMRRLGGKRYRVISFLRPNLPAWFRLWIDPSDGLVRLQEMRAEGHIMDHFYRDFDAPIEIRPPL